MGCLSIGISRVSSSLFWTPIWYPMKVHFYKPRPMQLHCTTFSFTMKVYVRSAHGPNHPTKHINKLHFLSLFCLVLIFVHMLFFFWLLLMNGARVVEYGHCKTSGTTMGAGVGGLVAPQGHEQIQMNWRWRARKKIHGVLPRVHLRHSSGPRFFYFRFVHRHVFLDEFQIKVQKKC